MFLCINFSSNAICSDDLRSIIKLLANYDMQKITEDQKEMLLKLGDDNLRETLDVVCWLRPEICNCILGMGYNLKRI